MIESGPAMSSTVERLRRRLRVARGEEPGDVLLTGGQVVNVFTGAVEPTWTLRAKHRILATEANQVPVELDGLVVFLALVPIQLAPLERRAE